MIDAAIVGGGVLGLWCARALLQKFPQASVAVFEGENYLGEHTSGRNSEVLHSGIYYSTDSLKHLHCLRGNELWRDYVGRKGLPFLSCGKIIAAQKGQEERLEKLFAQGQANRVPGMRRLKAEEIASLQGGVHIDDGFHCDTSGVLNVAESLQALRNDVEAAGGFVMLGSKARLKSRSQNGFLLEVNGDEIPAERLVNCAGLFAVDFRQQLGLTGYENFYVKGSYLKLRHPLALQQLVYPLPPPDALGLGVHLTLDTDGGQKFGPDTEIVESIQYGVADSLIARMHPSISQVFRNVQEADLQLGYAGVRPKVKKGGTLQTDFLFHTERMHGVPGYFEFLGIESPGVTAAPSLAELLAAEF